jgi:hypothetical protein
LANPQKPPLNQQSNYRLWHETDMPPQLLERGRAGKSDHLPATADNKLRQKLELIVGPSITRNSGIIGEGVDLSLKTPGRHEASSLVFNVTQRLLYTKWRDPGEEPKLYLFGQPKRKRTFIGITRIQPMNGSSVIIMADGTTIAVRRNHAEIASAQRGAT